MHIYGIRIQNFGYWLDWSWIWLDLVEYFRYLVRILCWNSDKEIVEEKWVMDIGFLPNHCRISGRNCPVHRVLILISGRKWNIKMSDFKLDIWSNPIKNQRIYNEILKFLQYRFRININLYLFYDHLWFMFLFSLVVILNVIFHDVVNFLVIVLFIIYFFYYVFIILPQIPCNIFEDVFNIFITAAKNKMAYLRHFQIW